MNDERDPKKKDSKKEPAKEKFDLDKFLKEAVKAGEILEKKEKENDHVAA